MSFVTYLVIARLKDHLIATMQTPFPETDPTRANEVKIGRFQQDPTGPRVYISISGGSQTDPERMDGIVALEDFEKIGIHLPPREVGGGQMWWRRGEVKLGCFYTRQKMEEEAAAQNAYEVYGRLLSSIEAIRIADLVDSYGEQANSLYVFASSYMESGGNDRFIWRGTLQWRFSSWRKAYRLGS